MAVTRSLGDHTMKEFVVGNPYTTETELTEEDSFIILACDGVCIIFQLKCSVPHIFNSSLIFGFSSQLWDVCNDNDAVDLIKDVLDPQEASQKLLDHALANFSTDNLTVMVIRLQD